MILLHPPFVACMLICLGKCLHIVLVWVSAAGESAGMGTMFNDGVLTQDNDKNVSPSEFLMLWLHHIHLLCYPLETIRTLTFRTGWTWNLVFSNWRRIKWVQRFVHHPVPWVAWSQLTDRHLEHSLHTSPPAGSAGMLALPCIGVMREKRKDFGQY